MNIVKWTDRTPAGQYLAGIDRLQEVMQAEIDDCRNEIMRLEKKSGKTADGDVPMSRDPMYDVWRAIISRCTNDKDYGYKNYGGRGVRMCESWMADFYKFKTEVGTPPNTSVNMSLDRIDTDGNYEPGNIRWSDSFVQNRNTRVQINNKTGYKGVSDFKGRYRASISVSGKFISLGVFDTIDEAAAARREGEVFYWGVNEKTKDGLTVRVGISDFDEEVKKERDELRAALQERDEELGDLPQAQAEMLTTIKVQRKVLEQALDAGRLKQRVTLWENDGDRAKFNAAITAIQEQLNEHN